jgi:hypothetical protein
MSWTGNNTAQLSNVNREEEINSTPLFKSDAELKFRLAIRRIEAIIS